MLGVIPLPVGVRGMLAVVPPFSHWCERHAGCCTSCSHGCEGDMLAVVPLLPWWVEGGGGGIPNIPPGYIRGIYSLLPGNIPFLPGYTSMPTLRLMSWLHTHAELRCEVRGHQAQEGRITWVRGLYSPPGYHSCYSW